MSRSFRPSWLLCSLVLLALQPSAAIPPARGPVPDSALADVGRLAQAELARDGLGGVTIGVVADGRLVWTESYGVADRSAERPASRETAYRIGSITKQFTAVALLQLAERGALELTDAVEEYVPEIARVADRFESAPPVTLLQLATMTSGLAREPDDLPTFLVGPVSSWDAVMIRALERTRWQYPPDQRYLYSNIGYAVLGAAVARAAGMPFTEYVETHVLAPLGMTRTTFDRRGQPDGQVAEGYAVGDGDVDADTPAREHAGRGYKVPNGALYTTVDDLARFVAFESGRGPGSVLRPETLETALSRVWSADADLTEGYGIGFQVLRRDGLVAHGHGGSVAGYQAAAYFDRRSGDGVIVLRNVSGGEFRVTDLCLRALGVLASSR